MLGPNVARYREKTKEDFGAARAPLLCSPHAQSLHFCYRYSYFHHLPATEIGGRGALHHHQHSHCNSWQHWGMAAPLHPQFPAATQTGSREKRGGVPDARLQHQSWHLQKHGRTKGEIPPGKPRHREDVRVRLRGGVYEARSFRYLPGPGSKGKIH